MWDSVESGLAKLLSTQLFKALLHDRSEWGNVPLLRESLKQKAPLSDPAVLPKMYPGFLFKAGILPEFPTNIAQLIPAQQQRLTEAARFEARLIISNLSSLGAVRERRASPEVVSRCRLFRLWD